MTNHEIRARRVRRLVDDLLPPLLFPTAKPLEVEAHLAKGEPIEVEVALKAAYEPFEVGRKWGGAWSTAWFHLTGAVPADWKDQEVVARIDLGYNLIPGFGAEGLVYEGSRPLQGVNSRHTVVPLESRRSIDWHVEAAANPFPPWGEREWPRLLPDYEGAGLYQLARAEMAMLDTELEAAWLDLQVLSDLAFALEPTHPRAVEILAALDAVALAVDPADARTTLLGARPIWAELFERDPAPPRHRVTAVGHAHIDSAWLWPIRETRRKCARTFSSSLALMRNNPDYVFVCSQAQQHAFVEKDHPSLFAEMKDAVRKGQFEPVGSMWVEPDTNIPSGESLVRQLVHGKRYFLDRYGVETYECWLPDAFGYSGNLPQILRAAKVSRFLTQKLSWNETNRFPYHSFWWQGIDGSEVLAHCPPTDTYNGELRAAELLKGESSFAQQPVSSHSLYAFGYGDGGGGPTKDMLDRYRRLRRLPEFAGVELGTTAGFFKAVEAEAEANDARMALARDGETRTQHAAGPGGLPRWVGELYLERHRAVQTTQAAIKALNRRCEGLLREAELWSTAAGRYPAEELRELWEILLLHQFHDILPGSSIQWVNRQAVTALEEVAVRAEEIAETGCRRILAETGCGLFNPATRARTEVIDVDGEPVLASLPGLGWGAVAGDQSGLRPVTLDEDGSALVMDNGLCRARIDSAGALESFFDYEHAREVIPPRRPGNVLQLHRDMPNDTDAWDVDPGTFEWANDVTTVEALEVVERGPLRASVAVERRFGSSTIRQLISMRAGNKRLDFECTAEWHERHKFLKVAFPVTIRAEAATFEIQFGHLSRPTHANTSWDVARFEVPAQRWADMSEPGFGIALLNDCKYGYDVRGDVMRLSLLRAPAWPDPDADQGRHRFTYALFPHGGLQADGDLVVDEAEHLNWPIRVLNPGAVVEPREGSALEVEGARLSAFKRADSGDGTVVRIYESRGAHTRATIKCGSQRAVPVDVLERPLPDRPPIVAGDDGLLRLELRPFELLTLLLTES